MIVAKIISERDLKSEKRKIRRLIRIKRAELMHLERLEREIRKQMKTASAIELSRKRVKEELKSGKLKFSKRALLNILKELDDANQS